MTFPYQGSFLIWSVLRQLQISACTQTELYLHTFDDERTNLPQVYRALINEFSTIEYENRKAVQ